MARLAFKDIKKSDRFRAKCSGLVWIVSKRSSKRKKITAWTRDAAGIIEMEFGVGEMARDFQRVDHNTPVGKGENNGQKIYAGPF